MLNAFDVVISVLGGVGRSAGCVTQPLTVLALGSHTPCSVPLQPSSIIGVSAGAGWVSSPLRVGQKAISNADQRCCGGQSTLPPPQLTVGQDWQSFELSGAGGLYSLQVTLILPGPSGGLL